ncbi:MAG: serine/threonine protein kinase, partial [Anaerolineae bacterium]|nr:serine/threonine protein kinase [Anaerolineae bacterium]
YDTIEINGQPVCYMVMPYFPGRTLTDVLAESIAKGQKLPNERILEIILDLAAALGYAHSRGMVHRDVKPPNVMFDEHDRAILTDFGIARLKEGVSLTQDGATVGTPAYISPEQAAGLPVDARTDLYSLGIIVYEMLAGELPFQGDSLFSLILQHINAPIPSLPSTLPDANPYVQSFIFKALAKDPADRFQSAADFANDFKLALQHSKRAGSPGETQNITPAFIPSTNPMTTQVVPPQPSSPVPSRSRLPFWIGGAIAAALIIVIAFFLTNNRPTTADNAAPIKSTAISSMTEDEGSPFRSTFSSDDSTLIHWQQNTEGDVQRQVSDGLYHINNRVPGTAASNLYDPATKFLNGTITMQAKLDASSSDTSGYGIIFRYHDESNYNVFAVDGVGRFSVWQLKAGDWHELRGLDEHWTENKVINPQGQQNQISVTFTNTKIVGSVNDKSVVTVTADDQSVIAGGVGIYVASSSKGNATVLVDSYEVGSQVSSMTGDSP